MLDMSRSFLPEALAGLAALSALEQGERRLLNQIRGASYLHVFDVFEASLAGAARERARLDIEVRDALAPLLSLDCFDHHALFVTFEAAFSEAFPVRPRLVPPPEDLAETLTLAAPLSLLILALHLKLVTQQHYLAAVRGDESLGSCGSSRRTGRSSAGPRARGARRSPSSRRSGTPCRAACRPGCGTTACWSSRATTSSGGRRSSTWRRSRTRAARRSPAPSARRSRCRRWRR
jgi:hypothetical protein